MMGFAHQAVHHSVIRTISAFKYQRLNCALLGFGQSPNSLPHDHCLAMHKLITPCGICCFWEHNDGGRAQIESPKLIAFFECNVMRAVLNVWGAFDCPCCHRLNPRHNHRPNQYHAGTPKCGIKFAHQTLITSKQVRDILGGDIIDRKQRTWYITCGRWRTDF